MTLNVSPALNSLTAEKVTIHRPGTGLWFNGIFAPAATVPIKALISVQAPTAKELLILPEGERTKDIRKFISNKKLIVGVPGTEIQPDFIVYKGETFRLIKEADWTAFGHSTAFGAKLNKADGEPPPEEVLPFLRDGSSNVLMDGSGNVLRG